MGLQEKVRSTMSLVVPPNFQHILRVLNTNIEGKTSVMFALTSIKGIGRRYANIVLKKADIPLSKRAGELTEEDTEKLITIMQNPRQVKIALRVNNNSVPNPHDVIQEVPVTLCSFATQNTTNICHLSFSIIDKFVLRIRN